MMPTRDKQLDALKKGLGRAVIWAQNGALDSELVREACLTDYRYDQQCEDRRSLWLWEIIEKGNYVSFVRDPILEALKTPVQDAAYQLQGLAVHFAKCGDRAFLDTLRQIVLTQNVPSDERVADDELIEVEGENAFLVVTNIRGHRLESEEWDWSNRAIMSDAIKRWGQGHVLSLMESSKETGCKLFLNAWYEIETLSKPRSNNEYQENSNAVTVDKIIEDIRSGDQRILSKIRGWSRNASEADLRCVLQIILDEKDPRVLAWLLRAFSKRAMPEFDPYVLQLCHHKDETVRLHAANAIEQNTHSAIRRFAIDCIRKEEQTNHCIGFLIRNFESGDEQLILDVLSDITDECTSHRALMDAVKILEHNDDADAGLLGKFAWFHTPCSICRHSAAKVLLQRGILASWMIEEIKFDANYGCRELVDASLAPVIPPS